MLIHQKEVNSNASSKLLLTLNKTQADHAWKKTFFKENLLFWLCRCYHWPTRYLHHKQHQQQSRFCIAVFCECCVASWCYFERFVVPLTTTTHMFSCVSDIFSLKNVQSTSWEDKHFLYHIKKLMQQKNINTKEIL